MASMTFEFFIENSCKALKWLIYLDLCGQQTFPVVSVEPNLVQDSVNGGEGVPSPLMSITGINLHEVKSYIMKTQILSTRHGGARSRPPVWCEFG